MNKQHSLRNLFIAWFLVLAFLTLLTSLTIAYFSSYEATKSNGLDASREHTARLALIAERIMLNDRSLLKESVSQVASKRMVREVLILAPDGNIIFSSDYELHGKTITDTAFSEHKKNLVKTNVSSPRSQFLDKQTIITAVPFVWPAAETEIRSSQLGWVIITSDLKFMLVSALKVEYRDRLIAFLAAFLIATVTWFIAFRKITEPIHVLSQAAQRLSHGEYSQNIPQMKYSEFNLIRNSFVDMMNEVERKIASLSESESRFRLLLSNAPIGIVAFDRTMVIRHVNHGFIALTGLRDEVKEGTSIEDFTLLLSKLSSSEDDSNNYDWLKLRNLSNEPGSNKEKPTEITLNVAGRVVKVFSVNTSYGIIAKIIYFQDITKESSVDKLKSQFIATAAHELRTPMTTIKGYAELLTHMGEDLTEQKDKMLEAIREESDDMVFLLDDLLDIAKIDAGLTNILSISTYPADELLKDIADRFHVAGDPRKVEFHSTTDLPLIQCDGQKIKQAVKACLSNAFKFSSPDKAVSLSVMPCKLRGKSAVEVSIVDAGIGMTPAQSQRIFERFYRADVSGKVSGTGLGMSLVKQIVDLHGGEIKVNSRYGEGTKICIYLYSSIVAPETPAVIEPIKSEHASRH